MLNKVSIFCCALATLILSHTHVQAQAKSRFAQTVQENGAVPLNSFPCGGDSIFSEDFENGLPSGWTVLDLDGFTPEANTGLAPGWQSLIDYQDSSNQIMASPSWYTSGGASDDWLISPQLTLGNNPCFSWMAYSVDQFFPELYEVLISTTTPDTAGFYANAAIFTDSSLSNVPTLYSSSLVQYAGQNVYIAFHQKSDDQFVMALDDVLLTEANGLDVGVVEVSPTTANKGDSVVIRGVVRNFGSTTVQTVTVKYQIDGGSIFSVNLDSLDLEPNESSSFTHPAVWVTDTFDVFNQLCAWTSGPNASIDDDASNDSTCVTVAVGAPVGIKDPQATIPVTAFYPNPAQDFVQVTLGDISKAMSLECTLYDSRMSAVKKVNLHSRQSQHRLDVSSLPAGMYFVRFAAEGYQPQVRKLILR